MRASKWHGAKSGHLRDAPRDGRRRGLRQRARDAHQRGRCALRQGPGGPRGPPVLRPRPGAGLASALLLLLLLLLLPDRHEAPHRLTQRMLVCRIPLPAMPGPCTQGKRASQTLRVTSTQCEGQWPQLKGSRAEDSREDVGCKLLRVLVFISQRAQQGPEQLWLHPQQRRQGALLQQCASRRSADSSCFSIRAAYQLGLVQTE